MFANVLRTQARLALTACRSRVTLPVARAVAARPIPNVSSMLRTISTSRPVWYDNAPRQPREQEAFPESKSIFVGNLPFRATEADLRETFEAYGPVENIRIATGSDGRLRGFAHVEFENTADAVALIESAAQEPIYLLDRDLRLGFASKRARDREPSNTLFFQNVHRTEEEIRDIAREFQDSIVAVRFLRSRETGEEYGAGFIEFSSIEQATEALARLEGADLGHEETMRLRFASPSSRPRRSERSNRY